ncbi:unnamed protein product [Acanthoscelides obtectus]|uniref:Uncharacterized protein n=1 Tax=Acanthoscelides obtectus TaxID=200917 RepID=A0A9P0Q3V6_ACAOB|nr:unnamed protein product [Acanthoscelides obtectus]CAK1629210.1 hypothetical protein AOBTE_LOCUS5623 [Acanthoscelides obtectus]
MYWHYFVTRCLYQTEYLNGYHYPLDAFVNASVLKKLRIICEPLQHRMSLYVLRSTLAKIKIHPVGLRYFCDRDAFKKRGDALENQYIRKKDDELLRNLRKSLEGIEKKEQKVNSMSKVNTVINNK